MSVISIYFDLWGKLQFLVVEIGYFVVEIVNVVMDGLEMQFIV